MYGLNDLQGLILNLIYDRLAANSNAEFDKLKGKVEQEIIRYTNYTSAMISSSEYAEVKKQLERPYAWILEYYALALNPSLTELQVSRIHRNYREAIEMLETFPRYYEEEGNVDSSSTFDIAGVVGW